uniref:Uncharacterized protein n=1 Tax=Rhizophora mucronata TaxID=61149 RepID=A0A2P2NQI9_RHIMU
MNKAKNPPKDSLCLSSQS